MNENLKRFALCLIYVLFFGCFLLIVNDVYRYYNEIFSTTYRVPWSWLFIGSMVPIIIGLLLALPSFLKAYRTKGTWKIDWIMLLTVGLPALGIVIMQILYLAPYLGFEVPFSALKPILFLYAEHPTLVKTSGILFGFVLLSAFGKQYPHDNWHQQECEL
ncbi:MAG: hypothetical protein GXY92_05260 [Syntrophomonadaceae bacterium]|nr:hypothetical protein [Syntrophomonadaceae bacterium]